MSTSFKLLHKNLFRLVVHLAFGATCLDVRASIIFESATLGRTGITAQEIADEKVVAAGAYNPVFIGARFYVNAPVRIWKVGGHFIDFTSGDWPGTIFAAIAQLSDGADFPDSFDLSTPDLLGATILPLPTLVSAEVYGDLPIQVPMGWYAIIFGSGLFGANGVGGAVGNSVDFFPTSYIMQQPTIGRDRWAPLPPGFHGLHFVVEGVLVPEPGIAAALIALAPLAVRRSRRRK